jgi:hypothetical protein
MIVYTTTGTTFQDLIIDLCLLRQGLGNQKSETFRNWFRFLLYVHESAPFCLRLLTQQTFKLANRRPIVSRPTIDFAADRFETLSNPHYKIGKLKGEQNVRILC